MEQEQPLFLEDPQIEDEEVELLICNEDDYTSLCDLEDINHLKDEYILGEFTGTCFVDPPLTANHILKDELCEMLEPFNLIFNKNGKVGSDQDGGFGYMVIEYFL